MGNGERKSCAPPLEKQSCMKRQVDKYDEIRIEWTLIDIIDIITLICYKSIDVISCFFSLNFWRQILKIEEFL